MAVVKAIRGRLYDGWLNKRMPPQKQQTLTQRSIFIFPSRFGFAYLFVCLFLFTLGTNYQNNLILLMSFSLIGFFITSILFSYANLSGLTIKSGHCEPVYAKDTALIPIYLTDCINRNLLTFNFAEQDQVTLDLAAEQDKINVPYRALERGLVNPGRLTLQSYFPLGLLRCWTHLDLDIELMVYPEPVEDYVPLVELGDQSDENNRPIDELNDFSGIKDHVVGESLSRISWKHVARNQQKLVSKQFSDGDVIPMWLTINQIRDSGAEAKLSKLAFAVNYYSKQQALFGLELNKTRIPPGNSEDHRKACLKALALW